MIERERTDAREATRSRTPLYVDVDGTLIHTDLLVEAIILLLRKQMVFLLVLPFWLLQGKAEFKRKIADRVDIDPTLLPYNDELVSFLREEAREGRPIHLASASDERFVRSIAAHLGFVQRTLGSGNGCNLKGKAKAARILDQVGDSSFAYAGNDRADLAVWKFAEEAIVVNAHGTVERAARRISTVVRVFRRSPIGVLNYLRLIRIHQWAKNILVFLPLIASNRISDPVAISAVLFTFVAFGLCASGTYIINDLLDLESDRQHPSKRRRPIAAGLIEPARAFIISFVLLLAGLLVAQIATPRVLPSLALYLVLTFAYSLHLKLLVLVDAIALAGLYTLRVFAGASAISVTPSAWLLGFSVFLFLSLALVKRCSELQRMAQLNRVASHGRDYRVSDLPLLQMIGVASGQASVLVVALYIDSSIAASHYRTPQALWLVCPLLLYWISRMWLKTARGEMHDDPIIYSAKDRASWVILASIAGVWLAAHMSLSLSL